MPLDTNINRLKPHRQHRYNVQYLTYKLLRNPIHLAKPTTNNHACQLIMSLQTNPLDLSYNQNLRHVQHPISADPRSIPNNEQGYEHERTSQNLHQLTARIPDVFSDMFVTNENDEHESTRMKCCCGRSDCAYLEHNNIALGGLERDLETAARLGQVCDACSFPSNACHRNSVVGRHHWTRRTRCLCLWNSIPYLMLLF